MSRTAPPWVLEAATLPVAFAQVREDPLLDLWIVERLGDEAQVALIASGGCTAALLAAAPGLAWLHLVDPNPAQIGLSRLKLQLLQSCAPAERLALMGHCSLPTAERHTRLVMELDALGLSPDALGPAALLAEVGPDHAGRYESVFAELRTTLGDQAAAIEIVLRLADPAEQGRRVAPESTLGRRLDAALDTVMALPNLVRLFGEEATRNPVQPFSRHFAGRLRHILAKQPADANPFLWQMLRGRFPEGSVAPWLHTPPPVRWPRVTWSISSMSEALAAAPASFNYVHLSNILDWLAPEEARATLELTWQALRPGGWTLIRQLNSTLDVERLGPMFHWRTCAAGELHARDRSFLYRALHLGRKR